MGSWQKVACILYSNLFPWKSTMPCFFWNSQEQLISNSPVVCAASFTTSTATTSISEKNKCFSSFTRYDYQSLSQSPIRHNLLLCCNAMQFPFYDPKAGLDFPAWNGIERHNDRYIRSRKQHFQQHYAVPYFITSSHDMRLCSQSNEPDGVWQVSSTHSNELSTPGARLLMQAGLCPGQVWGVQTRLQGHVNLLLNFVMKLFKTIKWNLVIKQKTT